ncbi:Uma2 family endonuclease [Kitasatospora sp. NPDC058965]|uniref:Uma2 family endonuclease n=1 Tax=Kitasatospora sp. NPDC058965 TaxID=3346682 RepID=UPI0036A6F8AB
MAAGATNESNYGVPEFLSWDELQRVPENVASEIELWDGRVVRNRRGPLEHQRFAVRMRNALESNARTAMRDRSGGDGRPPCWQVEVETNIFFTEDKSSFLTPDFLVRRCLPRGADTSAADVVVVGEVLSGSDTPKRRAWKMDRYAEAGIPWYWEVELDSAATWDVSAVRAYELAQVPAAGLVVKPLRPAVYVPVGEWEPGDGGIDFPEPFGLRITWEDLAF